MHSNSNKPRLRKLGIGLFVLGAVLDIISLVGLQQGFAGFALSNNAPFFLTSAVLSASTRSPTIHVGANRTAPTNQGYKPIPVPQSPPLPQPPPTPPVTFVLQGIPQGFNAEIRLTYYVGNRKVTDTIQGNGVVTTTRWGDWVAKGVKVGNVMYVRNPTGAGRIQVR